MGSESVREKLVKKYLDNPAGSSGSGSGRSSATKDNQGSESVQKRLTDKYLSNPTTSSGGIADRHKKVSSWVNKYNQTVKGFSDYNKKRGNRYSTDISGGYASKVEELLSEYEQADKSDFKAELPNAYSYYQDLKDLRDSIVQGNEYMAQFKDEAEYDRHVAKVKEHQNMLAFDLDTGAKEIAVLEQAMKEYKGLSRWEQDAKGNARLEELRKQYGGEQELKDLISQKRMYLTHAKRAQEQEAGRKTYEAVVKNPDFIRNSGFDETREDILYQYVNADAGQRLDLEQKYGQYAKDFGYHAFDSLTEDEKQIYNYYRNTGDDESAARYLHYLQDTLNQRKGQQIYESGYQDNLLLEYVFAGEAGLDQFRSGVQGIGNLIAGRDDYVAPSAKQYASQMMREDLADDGWKLPSWLGGASLGQVGYDAITTTANMAPSVALGMVNPYLGAASMAATATGNAYQEAINEGYTVDQARGYGILSGASELVMEKVLGGISAFGGNALGKYFTKNMKNADTALKQIAKEIGGSILSEFGEEYLQEVLTPVFQNLTLGTNEDVNLVSAEAWYAGILGAITGGIMEGPQAVIKGRNATADGKPTAETPLATESAGNATPSGVTDEYTATEADTLTTELPTAEKSTAVGDKMAATESATGKENLQVGQTAKVGVSKMETVQVKPDMDSFAKQFGTQAEAVRRNYMKGQDLQEYQVGFQAAYAMGLEGGNPKALNERTIPYLTASQRDIAFSLGRDAAAAQKHSTEGKAIRTSTGEVLENLEFAEFKDGKAVMRSGKTDVDVEDINFGTSDEAVIVQTISGLNSITPDSANVILKGYDPDGDVPALNYAKGVEEAYNYGYYGYAPSEMVQESSFASDLTSKQRSDAYTLGRLARQTDTETKAKANAQRAQTDAQSGVMIEHDGKIVSFDSVKPQMNAKREIAVQTAKVLTDLGLGGRFVFFESKQNSKGEWVHTTKNGTEVRANGMYYKDGTIYIDLNSGKGGAGLALFTLSHELTHFIEHWSPQKYQELADFVVGEYGRRGVSVNNLVLSKQKAMIRDGQKSATYEQAYHEVVADSMETLFADGEMVRKLQKLKDKDKSLFNKMKGYVDKLARKINLYYSKLNPDSVEGKLVADMDGSIRDIQDKFAQALVESSENYRSIGGWDLTEFAAALNRDGEPLFQYRAMEADTDTYRDMLKKWGGMSNTQIENLFTTIDRALEIIRDNLEALDYAWEADIDDRAFSPVKPNSDSLYQVSLDFSTLCRKRILQQTVQAQLQQALNKPLTREEGIAIRDALMEIQKEGRQIEVACALCYVESARMKSPEQIRRFIENREKVIKEFFAAKSGGDIKAKVKQAEQEARQRLGVGDKPLKQLSGAEAAQIRQAKKDAKAAYVPTAKEQAVIDYAKTLTVHDFTSPEGLENLAKNHRDLFDAYTSYIRNATKSKGIENDTWFRAGDSKSISDTLIANMNRENGLRSQSWSDFQVIHLLDYIAATIEMATRNAKEQAYTKVPDFVELMGQTGVMINMSLIPTAEFDGTLRYDSVEGIDYNRSLELREKYPDTAGTICIGMNNDQIRLMLADSNIDYVIPYHRSGMAKHIRKAMHIPTWDEYQDYQSEKKLSRAAAQAQADKYKVKLLEEGDPNYQKHTSFSEWFDLTEAKKIAEYENRFPSDEKKRQEYGVMYGGYMAMKNAGDSYLRLCAERGLSPKFSHEKADFTGEDNYWKLLIDRKMVNNATGDIIEQKTIKPIFDEGEILRILNDELERYGTVKADQEYAIRRVAEKYLSGELKGGMSGDAVAKVMHKPVDNVTVVSIAEAAKDAGIQLQVRAHDNDQAVKTIDVSTEKIERNTNALAGMSSVCSIDKSKLQRTGKRPADIFAEHFERWGNQLFSDELGNIALKNSSVKSEIRHGITAEKIASIEAIPAVLREGKIIFAGRKSGSDVWRIVVGAPIDIGGTPYYMGVMIQRDSRNQRLYLHNVAIEKEISDISQADLLTTGADENNEHLFITNILQKALSVKYKNLGGQKVQKSSRDMETKSARTRLADAFEPLVKTATERKLLEDYRKDIASMEEQEVILREQNRQIRELSFAKGKRDQNQLLNLKIEAKKTSNRINIYDQRLLKMEAMAPLKRLMEQQKKDAYAAAEQKGREALKDYRMKTEAKQAQTLREHRAVAAELRGIKDDTRLMEKEFIRLARQYEKMEANGEKQNAKNAQSIADLKAALKQEAKNHRDDQNAWEKEFNRLLSEYELSGRKIDRLEETIKQQRKSAKDKVESRHRTAMRNKVQKVVKELNDYLLKGTKEKHIPIELQKAVAEALDAVNMDTVGAEERIAKLKEQLISAKTPEQIQEISRKIDRVTNMGNKMQDKIQSLKNAYDKFIHSDDSMVANAHDEVVAAKLESVIESVGDTALRDMTMQQLEDVYDMYRMVLTTIRNANKLFKTQRYATIAETSDKVMTEVRAAGGKRQYSIAAWEAIKKNFGWNNLKPVYAFEWIGSKTFREIFNSVRKGEDVWAKDVTEARAFYLDKAKEYGYSQWNMDEWYEFTSASDMDFSLNLGQIMSLYAYSKREQAADHIRRGGIVIDESTEINMKTKLGVKLKFNPTEATAYNITDETLQEIISKLTPEQKAFVDEMQKYLSTTMGDKGNEVSLAMYGIKLFKEKNYFPLKSAGQYMAKAREQQAGDVKIKNAGFSKETVKKASNPVVLTPFMNVWAGHINEMSMYHAFVLPLEDFYRVYNFKTPVSDNGAIESVNATIQNAYGKSANQYIEQLLKDLNGGARVDSTTDVISKGMSLFKKGAVFASLSVVVQQPSAIARAVALIDVKHFIGGKVDSKRHKQLWEEVKKYAPVAVIKEMGYFDTGMGQSTEDFLMGQEYETLSEKVKAVFTDEKYRDEVLGKLPGLADEITWCKIWEAVKRETKAKNPEMDVGSEAFLKTAGDRFTEVIVKTQVYDSVLSRSANMRSKDTGMKMATAFMAEPTTSINMVADALLKGKRDGIEGKRFCRKAIGAVVASQILNSILVSFVYAARDDDENESYWEKYLSSLVSGTLDGINPATYIPFIKDIVSIAQGYSVERSDMAVISDLWTAMQNLTKDDVSAWKKVEGFAGSICQIFGLPVKNIMRDARAMYQAVETILNGEETTGRGIRYAVKEGITGKATSNKQQLYESRLAGDEEHAKRVEARYDDEKSANAAVRSAIRESFMDDEIDMAKAQRDLILHGGIDASEAHWTMDEWEYAKETGSTDGYGKYNDFYTAVETGQNLTTVIQEYTDNGVTKTTLSGQITQHYKDKYLEMDKTSRANIKEYLVNAYEQCGVDREKAMDKIADWDFEATNGFDWSNRKKAYLEGTVSAKEMEKLLIVKGGYSEEDAPRQIEAWEWDRNGIEDATTSAVRVYHEYCEAEGISRQDFMKIRKFANNTENDVDEEGNKIAYSAVRKIMAEINKLDLDPEQKTALARSMGWKESTVQKYKLW